MSQLDIFKILNSDQEYIRQILSKIINNEFNNKPKEKYYYVKITYSNCEGYWKLLNNNVIAFKANTLNEAKFLNFVLDSLFFDHEIHLSDYIYQLRDNSINEQKEVPLWEDISRRYDNFDDEEKKYFIRKIRSMSKPLYRHRSIETIFENLSDIDKVNIKNYIDVNMGEEEEKKEEYNEDDEEYDEENYLKQMARDAGRFQEDENMTLSNLFNIIVNPNYPDTHIKISLFKTLKQPKNNDIDILIDNVNLTIATPEIIIFDRFKILELLDMDLSMDTLQRINQIIDL
jgi:hypothetical protein